MQTRIHSVSCDTHALSAGQNVDRETSLPYPLVTEGAPADQAGFTPRVLSRHYSEVILPLESEIDQMGEEIAEGDSDRRKRLRQERFFRKPRERIRFEVIDPSWGDDEIAS